MYALGRFLSVLLIGLLADAVPACADSIWNHNGSKVELTSDGALREIHYWEPRPGLPVTMGTVLFRGTAGGNLYSGTAYVFSSVCGAIEYYVSGNVDVGRKIIVLYGNAPHVDSRCNVIGYSDDMLVFSFDGCGCECGNEVELAPIFPRIYSESTSASEEHSCPYLYAWSDRELRWHSYGKVIRDARGQSLKMTQVIKLDAFATKFRLSEEEPERSFIDQVQLRVKLKDGSEVAVNPTMKNVTQGDKNHLYIPAYQAVEITFTLPEWIESANIEQASLSITGYYESLPYCQRPKAASGQ